MGPSGVVIWRAVGGEYFWHKEAHRVFNNVPLGVVGARPRVLKMRQ